MTHRELLSERGGEEGRRKEEERREQERIREEGIGLSA